MPVIAGLTAGIALIILFAIVPIDGSGGVRLSGMNSVYGGNNEITSNETIHPGGIPIHPCPATHPVEVSILGNSTNGFKVYNVSRGIPDYVLPPGRQGSLTYAVTRDVNSFPQDIRAQLSVSQNYDNKALLIHYVNVTRHQNVTSLGPVTLPNGTVMQSYQACYRNLDPTGGIACGSGPSSERPPDTVTLANMTLDHPGISISLDPATESLAFNQIQIVKLTVSVSRDAPLGTYWLQLGPSECDGFALALLTVGNSPYTQIDSEPSFGMYDN